MHGNLGLNSAVLLTLELIIRSLEIRSAVLAIASG